MLVRDPTRRCSLATVRKHSWMRVEVPQDVLDLEKVNMKQKANNFDESMCPGSYTHNNTNEKLPSKGQQPLNEQVLRVMQSLGIDPTRTTEVSCRKYYIDHMEYQILKSVLFLSRAILLKCVYIF